MTKLAMLELNELNFETLGKYMARGELPHFKSFFARHGFCKTTSEVRYAELEPWIQWVTAHTGRSFLEHGIFRLGDAVQSDVPQIWEQLESQYGVRAGAVSPMNAANRLKNAAFFVPDPWTPTAASGSWLLKGLSAAIAQAVNDNATNRLTPRTIIYLMVGVLLFARAPNYGAYLKLIVSVLRRPWNKVRFLDLFLGDFFIQLVRANRPGFCTLFVNGAAHLQHHYMLNSLAVVGREANPPWYLKPSHDPVGDIYRTYDRILGSIIRGLPDYRIFLVTGLHQDPCPSPIFYWRPRNHADLLRRLGCAFAGVESRMSRDFIVNFKCREDLEYTMAILEAARVEGTPAFKIADRQQDIFVEFVYAHDINDNSSMVAGEASIQHLRRHVAFVALKNGVHNGVGYFSDSGRARELLPEKMPLTQLYHEIIEIFALQGTG